MSAPEIEALQTRVRDLCDLIRKVHKAKGRYHTQLATCDLFDAVGLPSERPVKDGAIIQPGAEAGSQLAVDIEALQKEADIGRAFINAMENEALERFIEKYGNPVPIVAERDALQAEVEQLQYSNSVNVLHCDQITKTSNLLHARAKDAEAERDALRAELDKLKAQEPVDENYGVVVGFTEEGLAIVDYPCEGNTINLEEGMLLYPAAPQAPAPAYEFKNPDDTEGGAL